jgi:carbamoyltransferase
MKILGINYSPHDSGISYIEDGNIKYALEEEKFTGIKSVFNQWVFPEKCLKFLIEKEQINLNNIDSFIFPKPTIRDQFFRFPNNKIEFVSHHKSHVLGSYFTSGFTGKVLSVSHDGKGETSRGKIYLCEDGNYTEVHNQKIPTTASIAGIWGLSTFFLGWKILKDEGKVVGLAAHGKFNKKIYEQIKSCLYYGDDFNFYPAGWESKFLYIFGKYEKEFTLDKNFRNDFAYTLQYVTEEIFKEFLLDLRTSFPEYNKLCLSGGLFANVKLNQMINNSNLFDEIFIHPAMGDSGLALGAAISKAVEVGDITSPLKLQDSYLGESFTKKEWDKHLEDFTIQPLDIKKVGKYLDEGKIIGLFQGRTEYGPRALGNRSIICKPTEKDTHKKLNERLKRTEIMPFAPSILEEYFEDIYEEDKSKYSAEFMTLCFNVKSNWLDKLPAVTQELDRSGRPQIVKKSSNPLYYKIIDEYRKISNIPVVLNTSFNAHGEPINNYPHQVLKHLKEGIIDMIITENYIITK